MRICSIENCDGKYKALGLCSKHYEKLKYKRKNPQKTVRTVKRKPIEFNITNNNCFECTSHYLNIKGYPIIRADGRNQVMTRYIYEQCFGFIPEGLVIRHKCDNPSCINPEHLETGTIKDNSRDMVERGRAYDGTGEKNSNSKLNESQVKEIVKRIKSGERPIGWIAKDYGVSDSVIYDIKCGNRWTHITGGRIEVEHKYKNVPYNKKAKKWQSGFMVKRKYNYVGMFNTKEEAAKAVKEAEERFLYGKACI